jgi:hypothetical protein
MNNIASLAPRYSMAAWIRSMNRAARNDPNRLRRAALVLSEILTAQRLQSSTQRQQSASAS